MPVEFTNAIGMKCRIIPPIDLARRKQAEGDKHRNEKNYAAAITCYRVVVEQEPNNTAILNRLAWVMAVNSPNDEPAKETVEFAERARIKVPNDLYFRNMLGAAQYRDGQFGEVLRNLHEVDQNTSANFLWRAHNSFFQALCHHKLSNQAKAQAAYDEAMELLQQTEGDTFRWYEARQLQKEAESLLKSSETKP